MERDKCSLPTALHFLGANNDPRKEKLRLVKSGIEMSQIRMSKASKQYMFDQDGVEYLDCINGTAHVGHCHPQVVAAGQCQLARLTTAQGFLSDTLCKFVKQLSSTLPESLNVVYLCNSGSEANDLAIRLARQFRGHEDIFCVEGSFHGNLGLLIDISPKMHSLVPNYTPKDFVHIAALPDFYRGRYRLSETFPDLSEAEKEAELERLATLYANDFEAQVKEAAAEGRKIAAFIAEPLFVIGGLHLVPKSYFQRAYQIIREHGGVCIADEVQSGLGRTGKHMWAFQQFGIIPDIVTIGRPLGNGHPMAAVICRKEISSKLGGYYSTFGGNPVSCAMGLAVLDVLHNEKLISSAHHVGNVLQGLLKNLKADHPNLIGDVRGQGLLWTIEIIRDRVERRPSTSVATMIMLAMKDEKVLIGTTGEYRNILLFSPPLCFTIENCSTFVKAFDSAISRVEETGFESVSDTSDSSSDSDNETEDSSPNVYGNGAMSCVTTMGNMDHASSSLRKRANSDDEEDTSKRFKGNEDVGHSKYDDLD